MRAWATAMGRELVISSAADRATVLTRDQCAELSGTQRLELADTRLCLGDARFDPGDLGPRSFREFSVRTTGDPLLRLEHPLEAAYRLAHGCDGASEVIGHRSRVWRKPWLELKPCAPARMGARS
jgi:hypothetical protein